MKVAAISGTCRLDSISIDSLLATRPDSSDSPTRMSSTFHVFALPAELLQNLTLRSRLAQQPATAESNNATEQQNLSSQQTATHGSRACNVCLGATFLDVEEQRVHFRSDWHRYNVKIRLHGGKPTSEVDFAKLVDSASIHTDLTRPV